MKKKIINIVHLLIVLIFSIVVNNIFELEGISILDLSKIFELNLIFLGVGISLISYNYSLLLSFSANKEYNKLAIVNSDCLKIIRAININIKRLLISLIILIAFIVAENYDFPGISMITLKLEVIKTSKVFFLVYILSSVFDIVLSTLKLFEISFEL